MSTINIFPIALLIIMLAVPFSSMNFFNHVSAQENEFNIAEAPFYQSINGTVTSTRILNVEGIPQSEVSFFENAMINGNIPILNQGTFLESIHPTKIIGKGKGMITSSDGQSVTWNAEDIGKVARNGSIIYQGFIFFDTMSNGSLNFLKDSVGLYVGKVGEEASQRNIWQWTVK